MSSLVVGLSLALGALIQTGPGRTGWETACDMVREQQMQAVITYYRSHPPVFTAPHMQWAVPNSVLNGPPSGPPGMPPSFPH